MYKGNGGSMAGNSNPSGPNPKINPLTGEPYDPYHWDYLR
jgi:hypothetical protein